MNAIYTRYKDMKRAVRDHAACDIERWFRGYLVRKRFGRIGNSFNPILRSINERDKGKRSTSPRGKLWYLPHLVLIV
jgi:hypothetical protein